jgi:hypothetical protein
MRNHLLTTCLFVVSLLLGAKSYADGQTNRDGAIQFFADAVGTTCTAEDVEEYGLSQEKCNQRHLNSVEQCKEIAATGLPQRLSSENLRRVMLRFSLCRGMLLQGKSFELEEWRPVITSILDKASDDD